MSPRRQNIQHNDTQHNGIQHNGLDCDTQHKRHSHIDTRHKHMLSVTFSYCYAECHYAECHIFLLLCWMSLCWLSLCWVTLRSMSFSCVPLCSMSLCSMSLCWMSWHHGRTLGWTDQCTISLIGVPLLWRISELSLLEAFANAKPMLKHFLL